MNDDNIANEISIKRITLQDLSFESPMGQDVYNKEWKPEFDINMRHRRELLPDGSWEVVITVIVIAKLEGSTAFLIEVQQAGVFTLVDGLESDARIRLLAIEASRLIFPYLRESVESISLKGGFPSVNLQPPDFETWYQESKST
jgi:preprotein translocase subunit SecB